MNQIRATYLPFLPYESYLKLISYIRDRFRKGAVKPFILFTSHQPVITIGKHGNERNLVMGEDFCKKIPVYRVDRGGDVTFHDPGQLMLYPFIPAGPPKANREFVRKFEISTLRLLEYFGISAYLDKSNPGVWTTFGKIAAIGLNLQGGVVTHGMALYLNTDKEIAKCIIPCGLMDKSISSMEDFLHSLPSREMIIHKWIEIMAGIFNIDIVLVKNESIEELRDGLEV